MYKRQFLEGLREPLETGSIAIARAGKHAVFPARFQLIAAMNPCPCGYLGDSQSDCRCSGDRVTTYRNKVSGPLLDRIDLHVEVLRPSTDVLRGDGADAERTESVASRVADAWDIQMQRSGIANSRLDGEQLKSACALDNECWSLLESAADRFNLSARAHQRVLRVSRTIADLARAKKIAPPHIAEALSLRCLDRRV